MRRSRGEDRGGRRRQEEELQVPQQHRRGSSPAARRSPPARLPAQPPPDSLPRTSPCPTGHGPALSSRSATPGPPGATAGTERLRQPMRSQP